jgi:hypothetical protein
LHFLNLEFPFQLEDFKLNILFEELADFVLPDTAAVAGSRCGGAERAGACAVAGCGRQGSWASVEAVGTNVIY